MDDSARGMATQILRDMLNIGVRERSAESRESIQEDQQAEDSVSETTSVTSSLSSPPRQPRQALSDVSFSDASGMSISLEPVKQVIQLGDDNSGSVCIYGNQVEILESEDCQRNSSASNKIKFNPVVNYDWDLKYYKGNLLACGSKFIAYTLKGRNGYVVRILNLQTATRALIKGFSGRICDLAFAHANSNVLACIDEGGKVYIWDISEKDGKIEYEVKLQIRWSSPGGLSDSHRLCWCPFIPDEGESEQDNWGWEAGGDVSRLLAVTHDNQAEVIDVEAVVSRCGSAEISIDGAREGGGFVAVKDGHTKAITDIALSPDGAILTTASDDGCVKFWKLEGDPAGCIHEFKPHEGSSVSCLKFCDNHAAQDDEVPMWRFLITGAELNRELKVWCTVNWTCLQTVRFPLPSNVSSSTLPQPALVACLDSTATYLVLSDIRKKVLYVLLLHQNLGEGRAHFTSVSEFPLNQPVLSFVVSQAKSFKVSGCDEHSPHENGESETPEQMDEEQMDAGESRRMFAVQLQLCGILTKSMQQLVIQFQPEPSVLPSTVSALSSLATLASEPGMRDALSDLSGIDTGTEASTDVDESDGAGEIPRRPKLVTPDAFTEAAAQHRPDSSNSSVTSVSSLLNQSQRSAEDFLNSSVASLLSNSTLKSSVEEGTPRASCVDESFVMTPTSLPLPPTPPSHSAPDPSFVPIPTFGSSPETLVQHEDELQAGSPAPVAAQNAAEESPVGDSPEVQRSPSNEREADVILEDEAKEDEDLPEAQKPGAEAQDEDSCAGASLLIDLAFKEPVHETRAVLPLECSEAGVTGRESPESANAIPVTATPSMMREGDRAWAHPDLAASPVALVDIPPETRRSPQGQASTDSPVLSKLSEILGVLQCQEREIQDLRQQLTDQQTHHRHEVASLVHQEVHALGELLSARVHKSLAEYSKEETQRMEKFVRDKQSSEKKRHEQLQNALSQTLTSSLTAKLDKTVKAEIKAATGPAVQKFLTTLQEQLNSTMTQKLTAADNVLKDSIGKMVRSKGVVDAIGTAASTALQGPIQVTYTEAFKNTVLPSFEHSCQVMFQQINSAFQTGTQQYIQQVMSSLELQRNEQRERQAPVSQQLQAQAQALQKLPDAVCSVVSADVDAVLRKQLTASLHGLREELVSSVESQVTSAVQDVVRAEITAGLQDIRDQFSDVMAASDTTAPPADTAHQQRTICAHIDAGEVEKAFKLALSAGDLSLVVYACSHVDPGELFSDGTLSPPVLLSLIQQLSCDLASDTDIKVKFLEEALMNMDVDDEITRKHMPTVLQGLCQQLQDAYKDAPGSTQRSLKMLLMAAKSLLR